MGKDIILEALYRFQHIVDKDKPEAVNPHPSSEADKRLARLAIKKYHKIVEWKFHPPLPPKG